MNNDLISRSALLEKRFKMHSNFLGSVPVVAVKDIEAAPAVDAGPKWISVKDRLPEKNTLVLCVGSKGGMFLGKIRWLYEEDGTAYCHVPNARNSRSATHWMPLPEGPKEG